MAHCEPSAHEVTLVDAGLEILSEEECLQLLETTRVGRVAISMGAVAVVLPVNYAVVGGDVMYFTGEGVKLDAATRGQAVSFEVDQIDPDGKCGWSVLVVGRAALAGVGARARAEALGLYPWPAGLRHHLVRIRPELVSGRRVLS